MKICIFGAGAVGGLMGAWLHKAGHEVSVVARGANLTAIREHGLRVRTLATGEFASYRVHAESDPQALGEQDAVIVAVRGQSLTQVALFLPEISLPFWLMAGMLWRARQDSELAAVR